MGRSVDVDGSALTVPRTLPDLGRVHLSAIRPVDVVVASVTAVAALLALALSDEPTAADPDAAAVVLLLVAALPLVGWRAWPTATVVWVSLASLVYFSLDYPGGPPTIVTLVALYGVAVAGHRLWTLAVIVLFVGGGLVVRSVVENEPPVSIALNSALYVLVSLLGDAIHTRRQLARESAERLRLVAAERDAELQRQLAHQRLEVARELHDVMAHTVTIMSVQAAAVADTLDTRPDAARTALDTLRRSADDAMQELRATISILRAPGQPNDRTPSPTLADLDELRATVAAHGLDVDLDIHGQPRPLGAAVELTGYRVVQEALTNVIRHADTERARVQIRYLDHAVQVRIDDDGDASGAAVDGHGLTGLGERVQALDGQLTAGPRPGGGFTVRATLPTGAPL